MKHIKKGDWGYLKQQAKKEMIKTVIFFAAAFGVLLLGIYIAGTKNNLLTIFAVLGLLPAAKGFISCIMFARALKFSCPSSLYEDIQKQIKNHLPVVIYDLYMTSQDRNYPIYSMCCHNKTLIGVSAWEKFDYKRAEEHITIMLKQNGYKNISVKLFDTQEKYITRLKEFAIQKAEDSETDRAVLRLMLNLSL